MKDKLIYVVTAIWCGGCTQIKPILKGLQEEEGYNIIQIDAESSEGREFRKQYGFVNLPTTIVVDKETKKELGRLVGRKRKEEFIELFENA